MFCFLCIKRLNIGLAHCCIRSYYNEYHKWYDLKKNYLKFNKLNMSVTFLDLDQIVTNNQSIRKILKKLEDITYEVTVIAFKLIYIRQCRYEDA